jgi:hypothetical protein
MTADQSPPASPPRSSAVTDLERQVSGHLHECQHGHPHDGRCECVCGYEAWSASKSPNRIAEEWHSVPSSGATTPTPPNEGEQSWQSVLRFARKECHSDELPIADEAEAYVNGLREELRQANEDKQALIEGTTYRNAHGAWCTEHWDDENERWETVTHATADEALAAVRSSLPPTPPNT